MEGAWAALSGVTATAPLFLVLLTRIAAFCDAADAASAESMIPMRDKLRRQLDRPPTTHTLEHSVPLCTNCCHGCHKANFETVTPAPAEQQV